jgi:hypothetical protein
MPWPNETWPGLHLPASPASRIFNAAKLNVAGDGRCLAGRGYGVGRCY